MSRQNPDTSKHSRDHHHEPDNPSTSQASAGRLATGRRRPCGAESAQPGDLPPISIRREYGISERTRWARETGATGQPLGPMPRSASSGIGSDPNQNDQIGAGAERPSRDV